MASSMSIPDATIAQLLNLNPADSEAYFDVVNSYFGERDDDENDHSSSDVDSDLDSDTEQVNDHEHDEDDSQFQPVTPDLSEAIVPIERGVVHAVIDNEQNGGAQPPADIQQTKIPCSCSGQPCPEKFSPESTEDYRLQFLSMTTHDLDIVLLTKIQCGIHLETATRNSKRSQQTERKSTRTDYAHLGKRICRDFFRYLHSIGQDKLYALIKHFKLNGVEARQHANTKRLPKNALEYKDTRMVVDFVLNYAEVHAIHLPGRTPKHWICDVQLLPSDCTKTSVFHVYKAAAETSGDVRVVKLRTFLLLWQKLLPFVRTMPPSSDLCWICQNGANRINSAANRDEEKKKILKDLADHLGIVKQERAYYRKVCEVAKTQVVDRTPGNHPHCVFSGMHHVSFDFAQQMHYPQDPQQPGPIYFKTPRKCGLFGVNSEGLGTQLNYLIDEAHCTGKGANVVISYLHDFLENHSLGETNLHLHADNCAGQNKNNTMLWYLSWRCLTQRNRTVRLSFLITGHTKFSPDSGFGLIKRRLRRTKVDCLHDIVRVVDSSSSMNSAKLVGTENGPTEVPTYDWTTYLGQFFVKFLGIKKYHHFSFEGNESVSAKKHAEAETVSMRILKKHPERNAMPQVIPTPGLSAQRQAYLYKEIRPFVADDKQDIVAPKPTVTAQDPPSSSDSEDESPAPTKKAKKVPQPGVRRGRGRGRGRGRVAEGGAI